MITINNRKISQAEPPYIIAELSANHGGSLETAMHAITMAKKSGANAVKIQTYTPDTMTIPSSKPDFQITEGLWKGYSLYDLYTEAYTPFEWHAALFAHAKQEEITLFSTPFDETAVDLLQDLDAPAYKIASFELVDLPLIKRAAKCGKPLLMSTGMASFDEIREALKTAYDHGNGEVLLFHCISSYPAPVSESNLRNLNFLKNEFDVEIGLSDHTISNLAATVAIGLGATAIEKHFKPDLESIGPDSSFSITPTQLNSLIEDCTDAWKALGQPGFNRSSVEDGSKKHRRSIYFVKDLAKGEVIKENTIRAIRPGFGLAPKYFDALIGQKVICDVERGEPVKLEVLEKNFSQDKN